MYTCVNCTLLISTVPWLPAFACGGVYLCVYVGLCTSVCMNVEARGRLINSPPYFWESHLKPIQLGQLTSELWRSTHLSPLPLHWGLQETGSGTIVSSFLHRDLCWGPCGSTTSIFTNRDISLAHCQHKKNNNKTFLVSILCMWGVCAHEYRCQRRLEVLASPHLKLELDMVSYPMWVLETELWYPTRASSVLTSESFLYHHHPPVTSFWTVFLHSI